MRLRVDGDRIFCILEPMVTTKTITNKFGETVVIDLPENHHERSRVGVVQMVGHKVKHPGKWWQFWLKPLYKPGDRVLLSTYAGVRIHLIGRQIDGKDIDEDCYRVVRAEEIISTLID